jgi:pyruvate formate lyase activating enzyme
MSVSAKSGAVSQIQSFCVHDGEGIRTTVFLAGCPLRCRWCANPETWDMDKARIMTVAEVVERCARDRIFYRHSGGGVTLSGGEPTMQPEFLHSLVTTLTEEGLDTALETSGIFDWRKLKETISLVDFLFFDLKHMDSDTHRQLTGQPNDLILENIREAGRLGKEMVVRVPLIPGVNDHLENLTATAAFVCAHVPGRRIELLPYHDWARQKYRTLGLDWPAYHCPTDNELRSARGLLTSLGVTVVDFK